MTSYIQRILGQYSNHIKYRFERKKTKTKDIKQSANHPNLQSHQRSDLVEVETGFGEQSETKGSKGPSKELRADQIWWRLNDLGGKKMLTYFMYAVLFLLPRSFDLHQIWTVLGLVRLVILASLQSIFLTDLVQPALKCDPFLDLVVLFNFALLT